MILLVKGELLAVLGGKGLTDPVIHNNAMDEDNEDKIKLLVTMQWGSVPVV